MVSVLTPLEQIEICIKNKTNFLLSGGAGCGKTHTLRKTLEYIFSNSELKHNNVACITFTNAAANEINGRIQNPHLYVSTIHEFLWSCISQYQKELKLGIISLIEQEEVVPRSGIKYQGDSDLDIEFYADKSIEYREYKKLEEGIVSHNEILKLSSYMFAKYPLLCRVVRDKYPYILIDEYQDTDKNVIKLFLESLPINLGSESQGLACYTDKATIGLFGDSMQSIYMGGVGNINEYVSSGIVKEIFKKDNFRCSKSVIELINKLRIDAIEQEPSGENKKKVGSAIFLYSSEDISLEDIKKNTVFNGWDFGDPNNTKELYLTHRLISGKAGYGKIFQEYGSADRLLADNKDKLMKHLFNIQELIDLYESEDYNTFIKKCKYRIKRLSDKKVLSNNMSDLVSSLHKRNIGELIELADKYKIYPKDDALRSFISEHTEKYEVICGVSALESKVLYQYEQEYMPYSTQHNVKGTEYENVFVVLDNGGWNMYNFGDLFGERDKPGIIERTKKLFYVCCSRAMESLVVFFPQPSGTVLSTAKAWFGEENVLEI